MAKDDMTKNAESRMARIQRVAQEYGNRSFQNYAQIRSVAETLRDKFCAYIGGGKGCVFLVPAEGPFKAEDAQSAAFSVSGKGYLPLKPIAFGLAVRVSEDKDYMRLQMTCRKEGDAMFVTINKTQPIRLGLPLQDANLNPLLEAIEAHIVDFFQDSIDEYDNGHYGNPGIGFDILHLAE